MNQKSKKLQLKSLKRASKKSVLLIPESLQTYIKMHRFIILKNE